MSSCARQPRPAKRGKAFQSEGQRERRHGGRGACRGGSYSSGGIAIGGARAVAVEGGRGQTVRGHLGAWPQGSRAGGSLRAGKRRLSADSEGLPASLRPNDPGPRDQGRPSPRRSEQRRCPGRSPGSCRSLGSRLQARPFPAPPPVSPHGADEPMGTHMGVSLAHGEGRG